MGMPIKWLSLVESGPGMDRGRGKAHGRLPCEGGRSGTLAPCPVPQSREWQLKPTGDNGIQEVEAD